MNSYLIIILFLLVAGTALDVWVNLLNMRHVDPAIPPEFDGWMDADQYQRSQMYLRDSTRLGLWESLVSTGVLIAFILAGGFGVVDAAARAWGGGVYSAGLIFAGLLVVGSRLLQLPFSVIDTFRIEERYGFNRTRPGTFALDEIKGLVLGLLIGGPLFMAVLWFFLHAGGWAWAASWGTVVVVQVILVTIAPVVIMPLFNKFTPLPEGDLRRAIEDYARREGFHLSGIFTMDGSKRSAKSNAFFTGFGKWRRIVLYDTLIEKHTTDELVAVLAHEVGHYKLRHIHQQLILSIAGMGLMFFILHLFITEPGLYRAFGVSPDPVGGHPPIYAGMVFFGFLFAPISMLLALLQNMISRRHEYQADRFAVRTTDRAAPMIEALKKLSVDNLSNLRPHPLKVWLSYSHPPVPARLRAIRETAGAT